MLHDNKLLRDELEESKKVSAYENFPFLKINGVSYTGKINIHDVKLWICEKILPIGQCQNSSGVDSVTGYKGLYYIIGLILV
jgi:hypothetical protein